VHHLLQSGINVLLIQTKIFNDGQVERFITAKEKMCMINLIN